MPIIQLSYRDDVPVAYDVAVYGEHVADVGDGGKEVEGVCAINVIGLAKDNGASKSKDSNEVREKPRGVGDVAREGAKMKAVEEVVLYQGKGL